MSKTKITPRPETSSDNSQIAPEQLLRSKEVAKRLDCTSRNIELMADRGVIRRIVLGPRCHRFLWSNVVAALKI